MATTEMTFDARNLLEQLLAGRRLVENDLSTVMKIREGQYLDFKDGKLTSKSERAHGCDIVRRYVTGFANADGGVLALGISEDEPRSISACHPIGKEPLDKWAEGLLHDVVGYLSPPPRFQVLDTASGPVLIIAVARAPRLVPCVEARAANYWLRINQTTIKVPDYLISDLVLGRRQHAELIPRVTRVKYRDVHQCVRVTISLTFENVSLKTADAVRLGAVSWSFEEAGPSVPSALRPYLDVIEPQVGRAYWTLIHSPNLVELGSIGAFAQSPIAGIELMLFAPRSADLATCAMYVLPRDSPPTFYEISVNTAPVLSYCADAITIEHVQISRSERPRVAFERDGGTVPP